MTGLTQPANGTAVLNADGTVSYTPKASFSAGTDTFVYKVTDGAAQSNPATVSVTINAAPTAGSDTATTNKNSPVTINVLANDKDGNNDALSVTGIVQPLNGSVLLNAGGTLTYTPKAGFAGTDKFTYKADDGLAQSTAATVTVTVVNGTPVAVNDSISTNKGAAVSIAVLANDTDPDKDVLTVTGLVQPANGSAVIGPNGVITYTPKAGFVGADMFTYKASDGSATSSAATVTVTVVAAGNAAPVAINDTANATTTAPVTINVLANDTDADGDALKVANFTQGGNGSVSLTNGTLTYTPKAGWTGTDAFTYQAADPSNALSNVATVTVVVSSAANKAPTAFNDSASTRKGTAVTINLLANDTDPNGDPLTVTGLTKPANGSFILNSSGTITYTPKKGFVGTDTFTYRASDGKLSSSPATVTITVG